MITLNNFLNSHLEAIHLGIIPQHISIFANEFPEFYDDSTVWPFHFSEDDSTPSLEQLSEITYLYLDPRAWSLDKFYLEYLPNLRELYLQHPGSPDLDFLRKIPQLQVLQLNCEQLPDQTPLLALKDLRHLLLEIGNPDIAALSALPQLEYVYFDSADFHDILAFLQQHPDCLVDFVDSEFGVRFDARYCLGLPFRYFPIEENAELSIFIYPLLEGDLFEDLPEEQQQHFRTCAAPIVEEILEEYSSGDTCIIPIGENFIWDGYEYRFRVVKS